MYAIWSLSWSRSLRPKETLKFERFQTRMPFPALPEVAADALLGDLTPKSAEILARIELERLADHDQPLGDYCRQVLGLDGRNGELVSACGHSDANEAIGVIVRLAWLKALESRNPRQR